MKRLIGISDGIADMYYCIISLHTCYTSIMGDFSLDSPICLPNRNQQTINFDHFSEGVRRPVDFVTGTVNGYM